MSIALVQQVLDLPLKLDPASRFVLVVLANHCNGNQADAICWPSVARIVRQTGLSRCTVQRCIKQLRAAGLIEVAEKANGPRKSVVHRLYLPAADQYYGDTSITVIPVSGKSRTSITVAPTSITVTPDQYHRDTRTGRNRKGTGRKVGSSAVRAPLPAAEGLPAAAAGGVQSAAGDSPPESASASGPLTSEPDASPPAERQVMTSDGEELPPCCGYLDVEVGELHAGRWEEESPSCQVCKFAPLCKEFTGLKEVA